MSSRCPCYRLPPSFHTFFQSIIGLLRALCIGTAMAVLLVGCAAQIAYREGKDLVQQNQVEQGLLKFQEAIAADPNNAQYRQAYLRTREQALYGYLEQANQFALAGRVEDAEREYRRALLIDGQSERARDGLKRLEAYIRQKQLIEEAHTAFAKKDFATAKLKLASVFKEDPLNEAATALQREIEKSSFVSPLEEELAVAYRKPVTLEFKDVALKQVFDILSKSSGLNFLFDKDVRLDNKTSIFLRKSTVEAAVHFILLTHQLEQQVLDRNTILIYPNTAAKLKDYQEMIVKSFFLSNTDAKSVANTLKTILKARDIVIDEKRNLVIMRDTAPAIKLAEKLVALQDTPEPEVMLEVEILEIKRTRLTELGVQWPGNLTLTPLSSSEGGTLTLSDLRAVDSSRTGVTISPFTINARKEDGDTNLLANPRIRVRNHEKAKILIGDRVPNITSTATSTGFVSESINYVDVGLKLDVEPSVYLDDSVAIKVGLEVSSVTNQIKTQSGSVAYQIGTRNAETVLRLKDGENQVLAGLLNNEERSTGNKVPGLGELPILGRLFGSTTDDHQKTEIVLSITPHLIRNIRRPDAALSEFRSGTETSFRVRPDMIDASPALTPPTKASDQTASPKPPAALPSPSTATGEKAPPREASGKGNNGAPTPTVSNAAALSHPGLVHLQWQGPRQVKVGDTFNLQLMMQSNQPITSVPTIVSFNSEVLQVTEVKEGIFLKQGGARTAFSSKLEPDGKIQINATRSGSGGASNLGNLATLTFRALAPSEDARVQLMMATPTESSGNKLSPSLPAPFSIQVQP